MPIRDDSLAAQYIRAVENPDSVGFMDGKWYAPPTGKGYDPNSRGFGMDVNYNAATKALTEGREGKWLSEEEERQLRLDHMSDNQKTLDKWTPQILRDMPSEEKEAMALGMLYRGDDIKSIIKNPEIRDAYYSGSDEGMQKAVSKYYEKKLPSRAKNHNTFFNSKKKETKAAPKSKFEEYEYKPKFKLYSEGGSLDEDYWGNLPMKDKSEMIRVAIKNGITTMPEIKQAYNKFAKGGRMKNWTMQDEAGYRHWRQNLPKNLRNTNDNDYDMRAAYKAGMQPRWNDRDKAYHLGSRDPQSGRILKAPHHSTYLEALANDASMGYYPTMDKEGNTYTETWKGNTTYSREIEVPFKAYGGNLFKDGGKKTFTPTYGETWKIGIMNNGYNPNTITDNYKEKNGVPLGDGVVQSSYLLGRERQKELLEANGYKQVFDDYGVVKKAGEGLPIFQKSDDANGVTRGNLVPIGNVDSDDIYDENTHEVRPDNWYADPSKALYLAGQNRSTLYYNPDDHKYYQKAWDVNDYGGKGGSTSGLSEAFLGNLLDSIGNPIVVTSGFQEVLPGNYDKVAPIMTHYAREHNLVKDNTGYHYQSPNVVVTANKFDNGGYAPSESIKKRITNWEGASMKTNRSFSAEAKDFNRVIPASVRSKLSSDQLDALFSYGYNAGMGRLKERVLPTLTAYTEGKASKEDVQRSMWASKDNELRGLTIRRNAERELFGGNFRTKFTGKGGLGTHMNIQQYLIPQETFDGINAQIASIPQLEMPSEMTTDPALRYKAPTVDLTALNTPKQENPIEPVYNPQKERFEGIRNFNTVMGLLGQQSPLAMIGDTSNNNLGLLSYINQIYS